MSSIMLRSVSAARNNTLVAGASGTNCRLRIRFKYVFHVVGELPNVLDPKNPAAPLIECTARKTLLTSSRSMFAPFASMAKSWFSMSAKCSLRLESQIQR